MKTALTIAIILIFLATIYFYILKSVAKISLQISFKNLDFSGVNIGDLLNSASSIKVQIDAKITNRNSFTIRISDFHFWIYYANTLVAQTSNTETNLAKVTFPANGVIDVAHDVDVYLNQAIIGIVKDLKNGTPIRFDYTAEFRVFGIYLYSYHDYFTYTR